MIVCSLNIHFLSQKYQFHFTDEEIAYLKQSLRGQNELATEPGSSHPRPEALSNTLHYVS